MKNVKLLFGLILLFISSSLLGQINPNLITHANGKYFHQNQRYKKFELHKVIKNDAEAYDKFEAFEITRAISSLSGYTTLALAGGVTYLSIREDDGSISPALGYLLIFGGCITGSVAIGLLAISNKQFKESINLFNENMTSSSTGSLAPQLELGYSKNGIGLVLRF